MSLMSINRCVLVYENGLCRGFLLACILDGQLILHVVVDVHSGVCAHA